MKLLLCLDCQYVFSITGNGIRTCVCGRTRGAYTDEQNAWYSGSAAIPLGFKNDLYVRAIRNRPVSGYGTRFEAFVVPLRSQTFVYRKDDEDESEEM